MIKTNVYLVVTAHHILWNYSGSFIVICSKVSKGAKMRNRYNQVPHLTQDTNGKVTNSQLASLIAEPGVVSSIPAYQDIL